MSSERHDRYATMGDLLRQLEPRRRMIRVSLALGLAAAIGVGAFVVAPGVRDDPSTSCGADRMTSLWRTMGPTVQARFVASGKEFSAATFAEVDRTLVKRAARWQAMREDVCSEPHDELASLRETCLDRRLVEARAFVDALATATAEEIERAPGAVHQLADLEGCVEPATLLGPVRLPTAPDERARITLLRGELAEIQAIDRLGRHATAAVRARDLATKARATRYRPLEAEVELELGLALFDAGRFSESTAALRDARFAAEAGRADDVEIRALIQLMYYESIVDKHDDEAVHELAPRIEAALERIGGDPGLAGDFHLALAWMARGANRIADLDRESAAALDAITRHAGPDDLALAPALIARIWSESFRGDGASETALARRLVEIRTRALGDRHPDVGEAYLLLAEGLKRTPAFAEANAAYARAVSIEEAAFGPDHWRMMHLHTLWGMYAADRGRMREARDHLDRSLAIARATSGVHGRAYGEVRMWIGQILTDLGRDSEALAALEESAAIFAASPGHDDFATISQELGMANVLTHLRRFGEARTHLDASLALLDRVVGRDHPWSLAHYWLRGVLAVETGHPDAALGDFAHARAVADRRDPGIVETLADIDFDEARALAALHREPDRARKLAESARDVYRDYPELVTRRAEIDRWLAR
jgi:tetratricopeptide (TPR) repeat protein